ncbi:hypothetical protein CEXT_507511 [Caerostris extrusa]|uniref:Uncharacterized protein n=1 Tax=Caerostris extrusa TaxID=172846 RepID=A0AAV4V179_CAEEX|nr:hypothetical protein CEXT_507511 [Caerostris extrusa]
MSSDEGTERNQDSSTLQATHLSNQHKSGSEYQQPAHWTSGWLISSVFNWLAVVVCFRFIGILLGKCTGMMESLDAVLPGSFIREESVSVF